MSANVELLEHLKQGGLYVGVEIPPLPGQERGRRASHARNGLLSTIMSSAQVVANPAVVSTGTGTGTFTLEGTTLTYTIDALLPEASGVITAAHIHGQFPLPSQ